MNLNEIKEILPTLTNVNFELQNGTMVPEHFHVTEIGMISKHFIDCGGTSRVEEVINFQLWDANDFDHRLKPSKLSRIIELSEEKLQLKNLEIEVEYQGTTIEKYGLDFNGTHFILLSKQTNCLAKDNCGIPTEQIKTNKSTCTPGGSCC
jgi:hypothetical protein